MQSATVRAIRGPWLSEGIPFILNPTFFGVRCGSLLFARTGWGLSGVGVVISSAVRCGERSSMSVTEEGFASNPASKMKGSTLARSQPVPASWAVSYTHLDVYKRQLRSSSSFQRSLGTLQKPSTGLCPKTERSGLTTSRTLSGRSIICRSGRPRGAS